MSSQIGLMKKGENKMLRNRLKDKTGKTGSFSAVSSMNKVLIILAVSPAASSGSRLWSRGRWWGGWPGCGPGSQTPRSSRRTQTVHEKLWGKSSCWAIPQRCGPRYLSSEQTWRMCSASHNSATSIEWKSQWCFSWKNIWLFLKNNFDLFFIYSS